MATTFSVKAILSAVDKGFSSTMKGAMGVCGKLDKKMNSFTTGMLQGAGQQAFGMLTSGAANLVGEVNSASKSWQTFEGNMKNFGKSEKDIAKVTKELQGFAETTVYSSSDMASTYAQLEAVGVGSMKKLSKGTSGLVKGFGGLAAAAEDPQQAMKSLSQQATQMAAKPKVAWEDFKIMLEQSPAGMAAVAKSMGMSTEKLISKIQAGEVKTEDFLAAIEKAGNSKGFQTMATEAKTMDQAFDGLKETAANKLLPAFNLVSQKGIKGIDSIANKLSKLDGEEIANKVSGWITKAEPYWNQFKKVLTITGGIIKKVGGFLLEHSNVLSKAIPIVLGMVAAYKGFKVVNTVVGGVKSFADSISTMAGKTGSKVAENLNKTSAAQKSCGSASKVTSTQMLGAAKSFMMLGAGVIMVAGGFALLAQSAIALANAGPLAIGVMAGLVIALVAVGAGMGLLLKTLAPMGAQMMPVATAMLVMGAAVVLVAAGFALLSVAAINLANAGTPAIACMVGMVAAIALLAVGAALLGPALTAGAVGMLAFGVAVALVGAGVLLASAGLALLATQLPTIATHGTAAAGAIVALGAGMVVFAAGALLAGAASIVLGAGLAVAAIGIAACGVAALVAAVGIAAMAAGALLLGAAVTVTAGALTLVAGVLPLAGTGALTAAAGFAALLAVSVTLAGSMTLLGGAALLAGAGLIVFGAGAIVAGAGALVMAGALKLVNSSLKSIKKNAKSTEKSLKTMRSSVKVVGSGLDALGNKAKSAMNKLKSAFDNTASKAKSAGKKTGTGFATGMKSGLNKAVSDAKSTSNKVISAFKQMPAKAKSAGQTAGKSVATGLRSGRAGAYSAGAYISKGFAQGMRSQLGVIRSAANQMAAAAEKAVKAKAKIHSPSKLFATLGGYVGKGFANGIEGMQRAVARVSERLVNIPNITTPEFAMAFGGELSDDYSYGGNAAYKFETTLDIDGREFAKATANYTQEELNKKQTREDRKRGKV